MRYYPVFLQIAGRSCVVIGGGEVGERKAESLCRAGAAVTVIGPHVTARLAALAAEGALILQRRPYAAGDVRGFFLACVATDDPQLQAGITAEAHAAGILLNVVDRPELCDFIVPALVERGDLLIAVSTSGASPALARRIRDELERRFGPEYALALRLLRRLRQRLRAGAASPAERRRILRAVADSSLVEDLRDGRRAAVDALLADTVGPGVSAASLGIEAGPP